MKVIYAGVEVSRKEGKKKLTISNKLKTSKVLNAANNDVSLFFGWDYTINKQEKTAWQIINYIVNRKADFLTKRIYSNRFA